MAVVTGAGAGMGEGIARLFAAEGARVVVGDNAEQSGEAAAARIREEGGQALFVRADVRSVLDSLKASNAWTLEQQVALCEIPAPPFMETARGIAP